MYIDDPEWKGPRCRFCGAPVKDPERIKAAREIAASLNARGNPHTGKPWTHPVNPSPFCSDECIRAKYLG